MGTAGRVLLLVLLWPSGPGCHQVDVIAELMDGDPTDGATDAATPPRRDAGELTCPLLDGARLSPAPAALARALSAARSQALCTCASAVAGAPLITRASGEEPADVGLNAELALNASSSIAGSLRVGGVAGLNLGNDVALEVSGDLGVFGPLQGGFAHVAVGQNAAVAGRIDLASLRVDGELVQPSGASLELAEPPEIRERIFDQVVVPPPCGCDPEQQVDIAALVRDGLPEADAAACDGGVGLQPGAALLIAGDLQSDDGVVLALDAGEELALLVEGNVRIDGELRLGGDEPPSRVFVFVGGSGTILLPSGGEIHGVVYAPRAELVLNAPLTVHGSIFVERVNAAAELTIVR